jgi:hypothetical protein
MTNAAEWLGYAELETFDGSSHVDGKEPECGSAS